MDGGMEASAAIIICTDEEDALWEGKPAAWLDDINPNSLEVTTHMFDSSVFELLFAIALFTADIR